MSEQKTVLITGASGNLGGKLAAHLAGRYDIRLLDIRAGENNEQEVIAADLSQWDMAWVGQFTDVDTVVHLAADPKADQIWEKLIGPNVDAVINVFTAAAQQGVRRVIYASSNHAMGGYKHVPEPHVITTDIAPLPGAEYTQAGTTHNSRAYGAAKLMGERIGKCYADVYGLSVIAVRIGWTQGGENTPSQMSVEKDPWMKNLWLSNRDYCQLMEKCIEADPNIHFEVINGMSNNAEMRWDIQHTRDVVGYEAQDDLYA
ncbi:MAG: NAD(P)-dependent oxidoreductase [Chloroflexota bacterium]